MACVAYCKEIFQGCFLKFATLQLLLLLLLLAVRTLELRISTSALAPDIAYATRTAFLLCPVGETLFLLSLS